VFPQGKGSKDTIDANLGVLSISNQFAQSNIGQGIEQYIKANLNSIRLTSNFYFSSGLRQVLQIIDDVGIEFEVKYVERVEGSNKPEMEVVGHMSDVRMRLTEKQYGLLMDLSNSVARAFSGNPDENPQPEIEHVDSLPQVAEVAQSKQPRGMEDLPEETMIWTKIDMVFSVRQIYLEIFTGDGTQKKTLPDASLSRFSLNQADLKYKMVTDGSMKAEFSLQSFTLEDTRPNITSKFKEIIPAVNRGSPQLTVSVDIISSPERSLTAIVTVDSPKVIAALDHLFAVNSFFMSAFDQSPPPEKSPTIPSSQNQQRLLQSSGEAQAMPTSTQGQMTIHYRVNIVDAEIMLLANPQITSTEAVVLSTRQIIVSQEGTMLLKVDKIGMFLCRMDRRAETSLSFIDNFDIIMSMDNRSMRPGHHLTNISIDIKPLIFRVSYRDVMLIMSIVNKVSELSAQTSSQSKSNVLSVPQTSKRASSSSSVSRAASSPVSPSRPNVVPDVILSRESVRWIELTLRPTYFKY